jgi:anti-sigma factor ChrR (cupin superfamily)
MSAPSDKQACSETDVLYSYALGTLPRTEAARLEAHLPDCSSCRRELEMLHPIVNSFVAWPTDVLRPRASLWERLALRVAEETGQKPLLDAAQRWAEPEWEEVAPGISCKLLATDTDRQIVSMLVRLAPGTDYPPHRHAGPEELHLLHGELWIDDRKLHPGDYNRAEPGTSDKRVWSETGCTCVLITSTRDILS